MSNQDNNEQGLPPHILRDKKSPLHVIVSICIAVVLIAGAVVWRQVSAQPPAAGRLFTLQQLAEFNGTGGRRCYVAVQNVVYEIEQGRLWKDGKHASSKGQAECGKDVSEAIGKSPHGTAKLATLPKVGSLRQ